MDLRMPRMPRMDGATATGRIAAAHPGVLVLVLVLVLAVAAKLVSRMCAPAVEVPTARELQVLSGVAQGLSGVAQGLTNAEIGRELFIGEAAVEAAVERRLLPGSGAG
jgi:DNA-binding NarL/FixJ family response regulator